MSGDVKRATAIFFAYGDFIRAVIRYKIKDEGIVEDLLHNFFLSLVSNPVPPDIKDIKGYIYTAITNDITDHVRNIERYHSMRKKYANFVKITVNNQAPSDALIDKEQTDKMIKLIRNRVTRNEFRAMDSRFREDLSVKESAERMNVNDRSVVRYISTGLRKVKKYFDNKQEAEK